MGRKLPETLQRSEAQALLDQPSLHCPTGIRNRAMLELMYHAGLRLGEVVGLRPSDIRWEAGELHLTLTKGGRHRVVPLSEETIGYLRLWAEKRPAGGSKRFFTTLQGKPVSPRYVQAMVAREGHNAGLERRVHPHILRHTFATELLSEGFDIRQVQELLGHANLHTTQIYTHVNLGELQEKVKQRGSTPALRQTQDAAGADQVQQLAEALANLPKEQRQALVQALEVTE